MDAACFKLAGCEKVAYVNALISVFYDTDGRLRGSSRVRPHSPRQQPAINGVVELFTSQGCSSCPPADRLLTQLAAKSDTVALTFPIDYWDFIGWKDTLAAPEFTARQQAYARRSATLMSIRLKPSIDGLFDAVGSDKAAIDMPLRIGKAQQGQALSVPGICANPAAACKSTSAPAATSPAGDLCAAGRKIAHGA